MALLPVALWGLEVPPGGIIVPATGGVRSAFRITMAAIDPSSEEHATELNTASNGDVPQRATLKIIHRPVSDDDADEDDDDDSDFDEEQMQRLLNGDMTSSDEESEEEGKNGGPSDPEKSKKARKEKAAQEIMAALAEAESDDDEMDMDEPKLNGLNGIAKLNKGKNKATDDEEESDSDEDEEEDGVEIEELVVCTLDPMRTYQQPLDITIGEDERVYFKVNGTHTIYLTGNYVIPTEDQLRDDYEDSEEDYDLSPDEDELDEFLSDESDILDNLKGTGRIQELHTDEDEDAPKLIKSAKPEKLSKKEIKAEKGKKRPLPDSSDAEDEAKVNAKEDKSLDALIAKTLKQETKAEAPKAEEAQANGEKKLSKKQRKKLKNNAGEAVPAAPEAAKIEDKGVPAKKEESPSAVKKVKFANELEKPAATPAAATTKAGPQTVKGVIMDDKKAGTGPAAKKGDRVELRYIGKLTSGKVFDSNKKGTPFKFKLGAGEVIKGWDIGVTGMRVGGERKITIPPEMGYGKQKQAQIPANSTLVFEVKVLSIS